MKNLQDLVNQVKSKGFTVTETKKGEKIKQTEHRQLKADLMSALEKDFQDLGLALGMSKDGLVLEIPHDNLGAIPVELDLKVKSLDFDTVWAVESYAKEQQEKAERKKQANKDKKYSYNQAVKARKQKTEKS